MELGKKLEMLRILLCFFFIFFFYKIQFVVLFYVFRVTLGNLNDFLSTSCITNLSFLGSQEEGVPDSKFSNKLRGRIVGLKNDYFYFTHLLAKIVDFLYLDDFF